METASGGYTIIEVMIVLAITAALFTSAIAVFSSQNTSTNFSQAMQDTSSKIQDYANQVATSNYPGSTAFTCKIVSGRASLTNGGSAGSLCLFLGLAIQATPGQTSLQTYTVLGNKDIYNAGVDSGSPALTISATDPEPALLPPVSSNNYQLTENYTLSGSATIVSSKVVTTAGATDSDYDLVGMYNGLPGDISSSSTGTQEMIGYACHSGSCAQNSGAVRTCIEEQAACAYTNIAQWLICFQDVGSTNRALLTIDSSPGGITTKVNYLGCS